MSSETDPSSSPSDEASNREPDHADDFHSEPETSEADATEPPVPLPPLYLLSPADAAERVHIHSEGPVDVPEGLPEQVVVLEYPPTNTRVFLVGTAHISLQSVRDVEKVMEAIHPGLVLVELCNGRNGLLMSPVPKQLLKEREEEKEKLLKEAEEAARAKLSEETNDEKEHGPPTSSESAPPPSESTPRTRPIPVSDEKSPSSAPLQEPVAVPPSINPVAPPQPTTTTADSPASNTAPSPAELAPVAPVQTKRRASRSADSFQSPSPNLRPLQPPADRSVPPTDASLSSQPTPAPSISSSSSSASSSSGPSAQSTSPSLTPLPTAAPVRVPERAPPRRAAPRVTVMSLEGDEGHREPNQRHNLFGRVLEYVYAQIADQLEVTPGAEFAAAYRAAKQQGCVLVLGDRPVKVTLARTWGALNLREKVMMPVHLLLGSIAMPSGDKLKSLVEQMKQTDIMTEGFKTLGKWYPSLLTPLIDERNAYMVCALRQCCLNSMAFNQSVVAVVGAGHLQGIKEMWDRSFTEEYYKEITKLPDSTPTLAGRFLSLLWKYKGALFMLFIGWMVARWFF